MEVPAGVIRGNRFDGYPLDGFGLAGLDDLDLPGKLFSRIGFGDDNRILGLNLFDIIRGAVIKMIMTDQDNIGRRTGFNLKGIKINGFFIAKNRRVLTRKGF